MSSTASSEVKVRPIALAIILHNVRPGFVSGDIMLIKLFAAGSGYWKFESMYRKHAW
jgi:hypothetical protein